MSKLSDAYSGFQEAGEFLAAKQIAEAEAFLRAKTQKATDNTATRMAIIETQAALVQAETEYEITKAMFYLAIEEAQRASQSSGS